MNLRRRRGRFAIVAAMAMAWTCASQAQRAAEYQVKAAFLQNFARFVEWPDAAGPTAAEFAICILGDDPFGRWIDEAVTGARIKERTVVVRRIRETGEAAGCQVVFISASETKRVRALIAGLRGSPVLTVSDIAQFANQGGIIGFITVAGRIRFVANPAVARSEGLRLTSELLTVAAEIVGPAAPRE